MALSYEIVGKIGALFSGIDLREMITMAKTSLTEKTGRRARLKGEAGGVSSPLVNELVNTILSAGKPVTAWEVADRLGDDRAEQVVGILNELTAEGFFIRFRAGLNNYYATPKVALTEEEPQLRNIMSDSLKSLLLLWRYKVMGKSGGANTYYRS